MSLASMASTVLLFRYFEVDGQISQALSVFKKRTGPHERTIRELVIGSDGVHVGEPLRHFRGIMTGVPQYTTPVPAGRVPAVDGRSEAESAAAARAAAVSPRHRRNRPLA